MSASMSHWFLNSTLAEEMGLHLAHGYHSWNEMELASPGAPSCIGEGRRSQQSWESLSKKVGGWVLGKLHLFAGNRKPNLQGT